MSVQKILSANNGFTAKYRKIKCPPANGWAILTCCDRRLSGLLEAAMGFRPGEAHVVRNAGNTITPFDNSAVRSLSALVLREGVKNIAVVGHSDCSMCTGTADLSRAMETAGVKREMAGGDLREFYGLIGDAASNIRSTVDKIAVSGLLPVGVNVYGLLLDTGTGRLTPVCEKTVTPTDIPRGFDSSAYRIAGDAGGQEITQQLRVRGQEEVRQFTGAVGVPKEVRSPVTSVKVPVNIRTPVREVKVPSKVTVHKDAIRVPVSVQMPGQRSKSQRPAVRHKETARPPAPARERRRDLDSLRGQSLGSWDPARKPTRPGTAKDKGRKYCPRCGAEYFGHVESCADCRVKLVTERKMKGARERRIRPVLGDQRRTTPRPEDRRRGHDRYSRRR